MAYGGLYDILGHGLPYTAVRHNQFLPADLLSTQLACHFSNFLLSDWLNSVTSFRSLSGRHLSAQLHAKSAIE